MNKSITQDCQNDKQISKSIRNFFVRFHVSSALKSANAYKKKGIPAMEIFQYLFLLIFSNRSMYMNLISGRNTPSFAKDTVYRFMKMLQINWIRFTTVLSARIIKEAIVPLDSDDRVNVLIIDDSMFERGRSKVLELLARVYDHAKHTYRFGFRMLTLGWSDGNTFLPVSSILLSSENKKNRINEAVSVDKRTSGYKRRLLSMQKGTLAMLELLKVARTACIPAEYVLFDSWFSSPSTLHSVKEIVYHVIGMVKKTPKMFFRYNGEDMSLISIYRKNRKEYLCLISTDVNLNEDEIIRIYGKKVADYADIGIMSHLFLFHCFYLLWSHSAQQLTEKTSLPDGFPMYAYKWTAAHSHKYLYDRDSRLISLVIRDTVSSRTMAPVLYVTLREISAHAVMMEEFDNSISHLWETHYRICRNCSG